MSVVYIDTNHVLLRGFNPSGKQETGIIIQFLWSKIIHEITNYVSVG